MLAVVGTVPDQDFPLLAGKVTLENGDICIQGRRAAINRGTPALLAAAIKVTNALGQGEPFGYLVGDIGRGDGSKKLYPRLTTFLLPTLESWPFSRTRLLPILFIQEDLSCTKRTMCRI
jgi:hypothetical protein